MKGFLLLYTVAILSTGAALFRPQIGLYAYVLFAVLRPQFLFGFAGSFANLSFIIGVAMLVGWVFKGFGSWQFPRGKWVVTALIAFSAWSAASAAQALDTSLGWYALINLSKIVLPFLVGVTMLRGLTEARILLWIIVGAQGYVGYEMNSSYYQKGYNWAQDVGFGGMDNNCFGISLVATIGPALALAVAARSWMARGAAIACSVLILHTILLTFSRGAMVGLLVVFVAAALIVPKRPKQVLAIVALFLITLQLTGKELKQRFDSAFAEEGERDGSAESRLELWKDCLEIASANALFGIGPDNWPRVATTFGWTQGKQAHSLWMQMAAELGYPGVSLLLAFYLFTVASLWRLARPPRPRPKDQSANYLALGVILGIIGFIVSAQFVTIQGLETPYYVVMAAVVLVGTPKPVAQVVEQPVPKPTGFRPRQPALGLPPRPRPAGA
jgi:putative inorganic carbon (HCO3(-)) transporter